MENVTRLFKAIVQSNLFTKYYALILILFVSGCCEQELTERYLLSDYEKSLVAYTSYDSITYVDETGQNLVTTTQPRIIQLNKNQPGPESCEYWETETLNNFINFIDSGFTIELNLTMYREDVDLRLCYWVDESQGSDNEFFTILQNPTGQKAENINLMGFEFKEVFVFNNRDDNGKVDQILYSSKGKGVEFISFSDGTYLKLK